MYLYIIIVCVHITKTKFKLCSVFRALIPKWGDSSGRGTLHLLPSWDSQRLRAQFWNILICPHLRYINIWFTVKFSRLLCSISTANWITPTIVLVYPWTSMSISLLISQNLLKHMLTEKCRTTFSVDDAGHDSNSNRITLPSFAELSAKILLHAQLDGRAPSHAEPPQQCYTTLSHDEESTTGLPTDHHDKSKDPEWKKYQKYLCNDETQRPIYVCRHQDQKGVFCNFRGLRQTLKRHINSVHLNLRYVTIYLCTFPS